ncbi:MAG: response regulator [Bacillota bacterium]
MPHRNHSVINILVIDDTEVNRYVVACMLKRAGFSVIAGSTGEEALRLARTQKPDLVVLDVKLPDMNGVEVCRQLKADPNTASIPILHLSAMHILSEDRIAGLDAGADAYLTQPVDPRELLATVNSLLRARRAEDALRRIQWLLHRWVSPDPAQDVQLQSYGDLSRFNTRRLLLDSVGPEMLREIAGEYLDLLDTSSAIYEANGDYALGLVNSGWCRFLDESSRKLCGTEDTRQALGCGKWHCHESCWHEASRLAIEQRKPVDTECRGGIRIYALPILAGNEVVGCINVGYGDPPRNPQKLQEVADRYGVSVEQLKEQAEAYESRPPFIIDVAKKRLHTAARLIGEIIERKRAERTAEEASRAKDHFLAVLSHELRTPLTPVVTALFMLQAKSGHDAETREGLEMIRRNVELETQLIDDLLDVTRIAKGKIELVRKPIRLCQIIHRAVEVVQADVEAKRLQLDVEVKDIPCIVDADATRLQQVFWNLLRNAIKFTPCGGRIGVRCQTDGDGHAVVDVQDSGEGIEPDALSRIFNAFEQAERSITRQFGGLGLGLTISKAMVELHGGTIDAYSEGKGKGACFSVRLPLVAATPEPESPAATPPHAVAPLRILLVEDHGDTAKMMRQLLMLDGHAVERAADMASALEAAARHPFDLLISDLGLPDRSGLDLMRELRAQGYSLPGIALSGYGQEEDIRRSKEAGFATHLTKPTNPEKLTEAIATLTGQTSPPTLAEERAI